MQSLKIELLRDGRSGRLLEPFEVRLEGMWMVHVPAGFETDFASVPRFFWRIFPPWGRYARAAVVHDYLYRSGIGTRKRADRAFLWLMKELGVPCWTRRLMYWGVRVWGWVAWRAHGRVATRI